MEKTAERWDSKPEWSLHRIQVDTIGRERQCQTPFPSCGPPISLNETARLGTPRRLGPFTLAGEMDMPW